DDMEDDELSNLASIVSIRDTWENTQKRQEWMTKLKKLTETIYKNKKNGADTDFVIDDETIYHNVDDFSTNENKMLYESILKKQKQREELSLQLNEMRKAYHSASKTDRARMSQTVLKAEKDLETLDSNIRKDVKTLRKNELRIIKK
ncbi:MAG: hypothetical protein ACI3YB_07840, partial [Prevotella sp.]